MNLDSIFEAFNNGEKYAQHVSWKSIPEVLMFADGDIYRMKVHIPDVSSPDIGKGRIRYEFGDTITRESLKDFEDNDWNIITLDEYDAIQVEFFENDAPDNEEEPGPGYWMTKEGQIKSAKEELELISFMKELPSKRTEPEKTSDELQSERAEFKEVNGNGSGVVLNEGKHISLGQRRADLLMKRTGESVPIAPIDHAPTAGKPKPLARRTNTVKPTEEELESMPISLRSSVERNIKKFGKE